MSKPYFPGDLLNLGQLSGTVVISDPEFTTVKWYKSPEVEPYPEMHFTSFLREKTTLEVTSYTIPILPIDPEAEKEVDQLIASKSRPIRSIKKEREDIIAYLRKNGVRAYIIEGITKEYHLNSSAILDFSTYDSIQNFLSTWVRNNIIAEDHKNVIIIQLKKIFDIVPYLPMPSIGVNDDQDMVGFTWDTEATHTNIEIFKRGYLEFFHEDLVSGLAWGEEIELEGKLNTFAFDNLRSIS